jgi:hypothetical protein
MLKRYLLARTLSTISLKERAHTDQERQHRCPLRFHRLLDLRHQEG